jgi:hypothetical protein
MFEADRLPAPDEMGFMFHPDLPDTGEGESVAIPLETLGFESACVSMEDDATEDVVDAWWIHDDFTAPLRWTPTQPDGAGWLLAAKYDTEAGPYALFVRPNLSLSGKTPDNT